MSTLPSSETLSKDEPPDSSSSCPVKKEPTDDHDFTINTTGIKREVLDSSSVKMKSEVSEIKKVVCIKSEFAVKKGVETLTEVLKETLVPSTSTSSFAQNPNDVTSTSDIPDLSTVKLEKVSDSNVDIMKEIVTSSTKVKTENEESTPSVDVNHQIKQEIVKKEVEGENSEVWNNVVDLLKESGYADKATDENIQHILGWLMNGMLPTEEQLHSLFNPTTSDDTSSTASSHPKNDQSDTKAENFHATNFKKESVTEESVEDNNKISVKPEIDAENEALLAKRRPSKQRKKYGPMSKKFPAEIDDQSDSSGPPHLSPVKFMTDPKPEVEIPPSPPRYSLRRKAKKKTVVDEEVSPTEMFYSDDSDEWTPEKRKRKEDGEAFLYTSRKRGSLHGHDDGALSKKKKRRSSPKESTSESDDDEKRRGKRTRRKRGATSGSQKNVSKMLAIGRPGSQSKSVCEGVSHHKEQGSDKYSGKPYVISVTGDGGNIQVKKSHFVSAKAETKQVDNIEEEVPPSTNVTTKIQTTTNVKGDEVITNITKTEIKTITRTEIIKKASSSDKVQNQTAATAAAALKSLPSTKPASNYSKDNNANKPPFNDVFACTKCILAFSTKPLLQRHMFRLHYDEYVRLKKENHWEGMNL